MRIVTHSGHFHADEILGVAILLLKFPDAELIRSRDEKVIETGDIVLDVGQVYDPKRFRFDHHQKGGAGKRHNGIPYASAGLLWQAFGEELAGKEAANLLDETLIVSVDAEDNGILFSNAIVDGLREYTIGDFFESFAVNTNTSEESEIAFFEALPVAVELLKREIARAKKEVSDWQIVRKAYAESADKRLVVLKDNILWKKVLVPTEALFVIFPRVGGTWGVRAVPKSINSYDNKKFFPEAWKSLEGENLARISGVEDAVFCHQDLHFSVTRSLEGALKLAEIALNS